MNRNVIVLIIAVFLGWAGVAGLLSMSRKSPPKNADLVYKVVAAEAEDIEEQDCFKSAYYEAKAKDAIPSNVSGGIKGVYDDAQLKMSLAILCELRRANDLLEKLVVKEKSDESK